MQSVDQQYQMTIKKIEEHFPKIQAISFNRNSVIGIIGPTGSGKSTLISYFLQAKLKYKKVAGKGKKFNIDHQKFDPRYPVIGHQMKSCTFIPGCYEVGGQFYIDLSGWYDTGSANQQIINSFSNAAIFKKGKKVKIVIVVEMKSLQTERGGNLVKIVKRLSQFFQDDLLRMKDSIVLVLSKVDVQEWTFEGVVEELEGIMKLNQNLTPTTINLLKILIQSKKIYFFPTPDMISQSFKEVHQIKNNISKLQSTTLTHDGRVTLSHQATITVNTYITNLNKEIQACSKKMILEIRNKINKIKNNDANQVNGMLSKLKSSFSIIKDQFRTVKNVKQQLKILNDLKGKLQISNQLSSQMTKIFTMISFYEQINGNIQINTMFLKTVSQQISQNITKLATLRQKITSQQQRKQMERRHNAQMEERRRQIYQMQEESQRKLQEALEASKLDIQMQRRRYQQQLKSMNQDQRQRLREMEDEIKKLQDRPPQVIYKQVQSQGWCQIF